MRDLPVHGRRAVAGRHVRPQAAARPRARPADQGEDRSRPSSTTSATCSSRPWKFRQYGAERHPGQRPVPARRRRASTTWRSSGRWSSNFSEHTNANYFLHTGNGLSRAGRAWAPGSPTAWAASASDLPGFVVLNSGLIPPGGLDCFSSGFLPPRTRARSSSTGAMPVADLTPPASRRRRSSAASSTCCASSTRASRSGSAQHDSLEAAIANYELAFRMQAAVPELIDLAGETEATRQLYGLDDPYDRRRSSAAQCLIARRLVERGVRFVELLCPNVGDDRWDQHGEPQEGPREQRPRRRPADRRPAQGPEGARPARHDAGRLGRRVRPHADGPGHRRPRPQPLRLHHLAGRRRRQGRARSTARPTTTATTPSRTRSRSTTCTPRCSTCWASTTSG